MHSRLSESDEEVERARAFRKVSTFSLSVLYSFCMLTSICFASATFAARSMHFVMKVDFDAGYLFCQLILQLSHLEKKSFCLIRKKIKILFVKVMQSLATHSRKSWYESFWKVSVSRVPPPSKITASIFVSLLVHVKFRTLPVYSVI